jgi:hypothetical protein
MTLSAPAIRALTRRENDIPIILLLTIEHADLASPLRLARNTVGDNIISNGHTFTAAPFDFEWPQDDENAPVARLTAINVDRAIGEALESIVTPCDCTLQVVMATSPDTIEREGISFQLRNAQWDGGFMTAELTQAYFATEPWPRWRITPRLFPSLFR